MKHYPKTVQPKPWQRVLCLLVCLNLMFVSLPVSALPSGESVVHGDVQFQRDGSSLIVTQGSSAAIVNYGSFSIGAAEAVRFNQPGSSARILNRVVGGSRSEIAGLLQANGQVYLINPNGILFTSSATVNVGGLVASGLNMSNQDFLSGNLRFEGGGGSVVNNAPISAGRFAYLVGSSVQNNGSISAGEVVAAAGQSIVIDRAAGGEIRISYGETVNQGSGDTKGGVEASSEILGQVAVSENSLEIGADSNELNIENGGVLSSTSTANDITPESLAGQIHNSGSIDTSGLELGQVILASGQSESSVVTHTGTIRSSLVRMEASESVNVTGDVIFSHDNGRADFVGESVNLFGAEVSSPGKIGGQVEVVAKHVSIDANFNLPDGRILIDPANVTINNAGGGDNISVATITGAMAFGADFIVEAENSITVADNIDTTGNPDMGATLALQDENLDGLDLLTINLNAQILLNAGETLQGGYDPGQLGGSVVTLNDDGLISNAADLVQAGGTIDLSSRTVADFVAYAFEIGPATTLIGNTTSTVLEGNAGNELFDLTAANAGNVAGISFSGISAIDAAGGTDEVSTNAATNLTGLSYQLESQGVTVSNVESLLSTDGNLVGTGADESFNLTADETGSVNGISFSGIDAIDAAGGTDVVSTNASTTLTGTSNQATSNGVIVSNFETLSSSNGNLEGSANADIFALGASNNVKNITFTGITDIDGGAGNDVFNVTSASAINLGGGAGADTYNLSANATGLNEGGADGDTFNVTSPVTANLSGGAGADTFDIDAALSGSIDGEAGADVLQGDLIDGVVLTGSDADGFAGTEAAVSGGFDGISTITGNGGSLTGRNVASTWDFDGTPTYNDGLSTMNIAGFASYRGGNAADEMNVTAATTANLSGGAGADTFDIDAALTGSIDGEGGVDVLQGDLIDGVVLTGSDGDGFAGTETAVIGGFDGINTITGNGGSLTGRDVASTWGFDGTPTYNVGANTLNIAGFSAYQGGTAADEMNVTAATTANLSGGAGADTFDIDAALTGSIDGEAGADVLQGDLIDGVVLTGSDADGFAGTEAAVSGGFDGINTITGNGGSLTGRDVASTWDFDGTPTYSDGLSTMNIAGFFAYQGGTAADEMNVTAATTANLSGGAGADTFDIDAALTGSIDGEAGADILLGDEIDAVVLTGSDADGFAGTEADLSGGFDGISTITGNGGSLTGRDVASTWGFDGTPTYNDGANTLNIAGFSTYQGGTAADEMNVTAATTANLSGGAGADTFDIDAALTGSIDGEAGADVLQGDLIDGVVLTGSDGDGFVGTETAVSGGFDGINTITGNGGSLTGRDVASTWDFDGTPTYNDGLSTMNIAGFAAYQGGTDADEMNVTAATTANLSGGAGADTFDIDAALTGSIEGEAGNDLFDFGDSGSVSGTVSGGANSDTLDFADETGAVVVNLGDSSATSINGGAAAGFSGIEVLTGNGANTTLAGTAGADVFEITGANTGNVAGLTFNSVGNLDGAGGNDTLDFNSAVSYSAPLSFDGGIGVNSVIFTQSFSTTSDLTLNNIQSFSAATGGTDGLEVGGNFNVNTSGAIDIAAAGTFNAGSLSLVSTGGDITVFEDSDMSIDTVNAGANAVVLSTSGSILDGGDVNMDIVAGSAALTAVNNIGSGSGAASDTNATALDIAVDNIEALAGTNIYLDSNQAVTVGGVGGLEGLEGTDGVVKIKSADTIMVNETVVAGADVLLLTESGNIVLNTNVVGGDRLAAATGNVSIVSDGSVLQNANISAAAQNASGLGDTFVEAANGSISMASGTLSETNGGNIRYAAGGDIALGLLNAGTGDVSVLADGGNITEASAGTNVAADYLRLEATGGIGAAGGANALNTDVNTLAAKSGVQGTYILESDSLVLDDTGSGTITVNRVFLDSATSPVTDAALARAGESAGLFNVETSAGAITVEASSVAEAIEAASQILLRAGGAGSDLTQEPGANIESTGAGNISLLAQNAITQNADVTTAGGTVDVEAFDSGITMASGTVTTSNGGNIRYAAVGDIALGLLNAGTGAVSVSTTGANIAGATSGTNILAGDVSMEADGNIGSAGTPITMNTNTITEISGNNVYVENLASGVVNLGLLSADGFLRLEAPNVGGATGAGGFVDANGGALNLRAGAGALLNVAGYMGTLDDPLELDFLGSIDLDSFGLTADDTPDGYVFFNGNQSPGFPDVQFVGSEEVPGLIIINGVVVDGGGGEPTPDLPIIEEVPNVGSRPVAQTQSLPVIGEGTILGPINRTLVFAFENPELRSWMGVFGNPLFIHGVLDVAGPLFSGFFDYRIVQRAVILGHPDLPMEAQQDIDMDGIQSSTSYNFFSPE